MKSMSQLLELRKKIKDKKPKFTRQEYPARVKLGPVWRKPKGIHSKMRDNKRGKKNHPSVGFSSPRLVRGLSKEGLVPLLIKNFNDLEKVTKEHILVISTKLGRRKKIELLKQVKEKKFKVQNIKDVEAHLKNLLDSFDQRKKHKKDRLAKKKKETEKIKEKSKEKKEEKTETDEDKKKREQEEKRKVLEGKQ